MKKIKMKFGALKYPFLVDMVVDNEHIISLNSDSLKIRICQKSGNKIVELLGIVGKSSGDNSKIDITINKKDHKFFYKKEKITNFSI